MQLIKKSCTAITSIKLSFISVLPVKYKNCKYKLPV